MLGAKKVAKGKAMVPNIETARENPSKTCKKFLIELIIKFYESETIASLDSKYVRYQEECLDKFKTKMCQKMLDALHIPKWHEETEKRGFQKFLENKVHDALWNAKVVVEKYGKEHRADDEDFQETMLKVDLFVRRCAPFAHRQNRQELVGWWAIANKVAELARTRCHLIALPNTTHVILHDGKIK